MGLTTAGRNFIAAAIMNSGPPTFFDNSNAYLGVGDSNTAFAVGQTDLQAASNKVRVGMEATYPQLATNVISFRSVFGSGVAEWAWEEWATFNAAASGTMLQRYVESLGTKSSGSWQLTVDITVSIGT